MFWDISNNCFVMGKYLCFLLVTNHQLPLMLLWFVAFTIEGKAKFQLGVSENKEEVFFFFPIPVFESHAFHPSTLGQGDPWTPR